MKTARWASIFPALAVCAVACSSTGANTVTHPPATHNPAPLTCTAHTGATADACTRASDCAGGKGCLCGELVPGNASMKPNQCVAAQCLMDSDCGAGGFCSTSIPPLCGAGTAGFFCHTSSDTCADDADCTSASCVWTGNAWSCVRAGCAG